MPANRRRLLLATATASLFASVLPGCAQTPPKEEFKPVVGQAGKDVIWVPTPDEVVQRMLDMAELRPGERVVDLGSGDGKIAIAAARRGARARGIEYNPDMVALSRRNARAAGVQVSFEQGDIFKADFKDADVVTLYLLPTLNERLRPILLEMKPGTRVTSHQFRMGEWEPDRTDELAGRDAHLWIVPAKVGGNWSVRIGNEPPLQLEVKQQFQKLEVHTVAGSNRTALARTSLRGTAIRFEVPAATGALSFQGTVEASGRILGTVTSPNGQRRPFTATRS